MNAYTGYAGKPKNGGCTMDNSAVFQLMLDKAIETGPSGFVGFDRTKNVQDQLQAMVGDYGTCLDLIHDFQCPEVNFPYEKPETASMEQLWLSFVMQEKYNRVWSSEQGKWVI